MADPVTRSVVNSLKQMGRELNEQIFDNAEELALVEDISDTSFTVTIEGGARYEITVKRLN